MCTKQVSGADTEHSQHTKMVLMDISSSITDFFNGMLYSSFETELHQYLLLPRHFQMCM